MFWADELAKRIIKDRGNTHTVATGITPSGFIHVGNLRETTVGDVIQKALCRLGSKVRFIWIADDFDRLRKLYPFLPKNFEKHIGKPLSSIPDPICAKHKNYAQHMVEDYIKTLPKLGIEVEKISATELYKKGIFTEKITIALENKKKIINILETVSNRSLSDDWSPYVAYCNKCGKDFTKIEKEDLGNTRVYYTCSKCGHSGWSDYSKGEGKLVWRVDWAARWSIFGVTVEPLGKEHAASGGSYDTGKRIAKEVFNCDAPEKVFYEFLYLSGSKGKMSSSLGNVVSTSEMVAFVPPAVLRYLLIKNKDRHIVLDPGEGLIKLINEYTLLEEKVLEKSADKDEIALYEYSIIDINTKSHAHIPFTHLVNIYQTASKNPVEIKRLLERTGHTEDQKLIDVDIARVAIWLEKYAPEKYKFEIQKVMPRVELSNEQKELLRKVADCFNKENDAEKIHNFIYITGKELGLKPKETFEAFYKIFLGKTCGPKVGWFLVNLDKKFTVDRLKEGAK